MKVCTICLRRRRRLWTISGPDNPIWCIDHVPDDIPPGLLVEL